eukprot:TRINITY_DN40863_c0_g1_i1.p1 TRINITY_DN40863_c0_g1~~TRINITY_DN40863_c0_g1_i1.p1  ORF type:complete len:214 (+),score=13.06 TRINITY_DN40863_c0_g1_i1:29-643(+)
MVRPYQVRMADGVELVTFQVDDQEDEAPDMHRLSQEELTMERERQLNSRHARRVTPQDASAAALQRARRLQSSVKRDRERCRHVAERAGASWASEGSTFTWGSTDSAHAHSGPSRVHSEEALNEKPSKSPFARFRGFIDRMRTRDSCSDKEFRRDQEPRSTCRHASFLSGWRRRRSTGSQHSWSDALTSVGPSHAWAPQRAVVE